MRKLQAYPPSLDLDGNVDVFCPISNLNRTGSLVIPKSHLIARIYVHEEVIKRRKDFKEWNWKLLTEIWDLMRDNQAINTRPQDYILETVFLISVCLSAFQLQILFGKMLRYEWWTKVLRKKWRECSSNWSGIWKVPVRKKLCLTLACCRGLIDTRDQHVQLELPLRTSMFAPLVACVFRQMKSYIRTDRRRKTIVELPKLQMPGPIRLNSAVEGGENDPQPHSAFVLLVGVRQVQCWKSPQHPSRPDLPDGSFHIFHES